MPMLRLLARPSFQPFEAILHDLSSNGLGLLVAKPVSEGTMLAIQLRRWHAGQSCILSGQVRHATQMPDGIWLLGCSLSRALTDDEIYTLTDGEVLSGLATLPLSSLERERTV